MDPSTLETNGAIGFNDIILLMKKFMHSKNLSQAPLLVLPNSLLRTTGLDTLVPTHISARNSMGPRDGTEYLKTAKIVSDEPWCFARILLPFLPVGMKAATDNHVIHQFIDEITD